MENGAHSGSIAILQLQFDPDLRLLSIQSFTCSPSDHVGFPYPPNMAFCELAMQNFT